jgi:predicted DNA-binding protein with PD1-like motif
MKYKKTDNTWIIVLAKDEKIIEKIKEFIAKENIKGGHFTGIGAISHVEMAHYNLALKKYHDKALSGALEIVGLIGNVSFNNNEPVVHSHISVGTEDMQVLGGHLKEAVVSATCEIVFTEVKTKLSRKYNEEIGLNLIDLFE